MVSGLSQTGRRKQTTRAVRRAAAALEAGDPRVLERVHAAGILRDAVRAAVVTALGLVLAQVARAYLAGALPPHGVALLNVAAVGAALAAGADRERTPLNSPPRQKSYSVLFFEKKKKQNSTTTRECCRTGC